MGMESDARNLQDEYKGLTNEQVFAELAQKRSALEVAIAGADDVREIESLGSTRSVNVGVAAGIAMYEWARQCVF